ncbi:hypothetical protein [Paraburkholderia tropica]|uniref:hypothetical protein n=1 Tax=Paraburkholderia tropica TaxID=92647 RepID=UPI001591FD78|nr:hypothetical protein [Paraburkholderia tropica]
MTDPDPRLTLPPDVLVARICELESRIARYERSTALSAALLATDPDRPVPRSQARLGRPRIPDLQAQQIAWARAAEAGGAIDRWMTARGIEGSASGRVRDSATARIRAFVFALAEIYAAQTGCRMSAGRLEQIVTRCTGYAKAGRALLRCSASPLAVTDTRPS